MPVLYSILQFLIPRIPVLLLRNRSFIGAAEKIAGVSLKVPKIGDPFLYAVHTPFQSPQPLR